MKKPFVTKAQVEDIVKKYPTPFHIYDEKGIIENAKAVYDAFSWNKGFKEYFAVKATPNPVLMQILKAQGCGYDCSSLTSLPDISKWNLNNLSDKGDMFEGCQ